MYPSIYVKSDTPRVSLAWSTSNEGGLRPSSINTVDELDDDPNFDSQSGFDVDTLEEDSPYPEVRSAVSNADDIDMPAGTFRAWVIGIIWAILIPGLNQFFFFRFPAVTVGPLIAQLLSFPVGRLWAAVVPRVKIFGVSVNTGPFTIKEHVIITIMAGVGSGSAYATNIAAVQRIYYNQTYSFGFQWMIVMSTQLIGFSIGGILRRYLVSPPSMIWPSNLVFCTLFNTLHSQYYVGMGNRGGVSRERFFSYAFVAATVWYVIPEYLFTALSVFSWVCWIKPNNVVVNQLFGYETGLGMSLLTFDWSQIAYIGSPLATPWWANANVTAGFVIFFWVLTPILYYTNVWYSQYMPISSRTAYDNTGAQYNVTKILNSQSTLDLQKYKDYSPLFISTTFAVAYGMSFASIPAVLVHVFLYYRKQIWQQTRRSLAEQPDIHARLMSQYPQVPDSWYAIIFVTMFAFAVISIELLSFDIHMPTWALVLALAMSFFYTVPIGMIQAVTNQQVGLNVIAELIAGYILPGRPIAMMMFKTWGFNTAAQGLNFASDFKLGHYMKIPPRTMFHCQVVATVIAGTVQLGVQSWMFSNIQGMCDPHQKDGFNCASSEVFFTASVIWGVIGPQTVFSKGQVYYGLLFFFLFGAVAPLVPWILNKKYPHNLLRYVYLPIVLGGSGPIPPATAVNYVPWAIVGFIFQYIVRRYHVGWWAKYNYVLSAALDSSVAVGAVLVFFCLQFPRQGTIGSDTILTWWGNTVYTNTADYKGTPYKTLPSGAIFGPKTW